jgi:hypothetical protein
MFSAYALQGISHAKKGQYTREELASLAQTNVDSLKEYAYFTYARTDIKKLKFTDPVDYWLEYKNPSLILHFTLPLKAPVTAKIMQIEVRAEQLLIHLGSMDKNTAEAASVRGTVLQMLSLRRRYKRTMLESDDAGPMAA